MLIQLKNKLFTFHYVSIKTSSDRLQLSLSVIFTFHYVSIKTEFFIPYVTLATAFTFHYVSIKTQQKFNVME